MSHDEKKGYTIEELRAELDSEERKKYATLNEKLLTLQGCNKNLTDRLRHAQEELKIRDADIVQLQNRCMVYTGETICIFCGFHNCKYHPVYRAQHTYFEQEIVAKDQPIEGENV